MNKLPTRALVESAFLASATATIFLINTYFPLGPLIRMLYPLPTALIYLRWGASSAWKTTLVAFLLLSVLMGPLRSIQFMIPFGLMAVMLGYLWQRQVGWVWSIALGTLVSTLGSIFQLVLVSVMVGEDLWVYSTAQITGLLSWLWQLAGSLDQPQLWLVQAIAIATIVVSNLVYQLLVHLAAQFLLERIGNPIPQPPAWLQDLIS